MFKYSPMPVGNWNKSKRKGDLESNVLTVSLASSICQEGQSERTFPIFAFFFRFFLSLPDFSWFFPLLPIFWQIFRCQGWHSAPDIFHCQRWHSAPSTPLCVDNFATLVTISSIRMVEIILLKQFLKVRDRYLL